MYEYVFFRVDGQLIASKESWMREDKETEITRSQVYEEFQRPYFEFLAGELYRLLTKGIEPESRLGASSPLFLNKGGRLVRSRAPSPQETEEEPSDPVNMEDIYQKLPRGYFQFVAGEMFALLKRG